MKRRIGSVALALLATATLADAQIQRSLAGKMARASTQHWIGYTEPEGVYAAVIERDSVAALAVNCTNGSVTVGMQLAFPRLNTATDPYEIDGRSHAGDWAVLAGYRIVKANNPVALARQLRDGNGFSFDGMFFTLEGSDRHVGAVLEACGIVEPQDVVAMPAPPEEAPPPPERRRPAEHPVWVVLALAVLGLIVVAYVRGWL